MESSISDHTALQRPVRGTGKPVVQRFLLILRAVSKERGLPRAVANSPAPPATARVYPFVDVARLGRRPTVHALISSVGRVAVSDWPPSCAPLVRDAAAPLRLKCWWRCLKLNLTDVHDGWPEVFEQRMGSLVRAVGLQVRRSGIPPRSTPQLATTRRGT